MAKITQASKVLDYIRATQGWIPSYRLVKVELLGKWIGTNGDRIARKWFEEGKVLREDGKALFGQTDAFGKDMEGKYTYYKRPKPKEIINHTVNGEIVATKIIWN